MSTQNVRPDQGFTERQEFRQRRRTRNRRVGVFAVVGAMIALAIAFAGGRALLTADPVPADRIAPTRPTMEPSRTDEVARLFTIDPATGETALILEAAGGLDEPEYAPNDPRIVYQSEAEDGTSQLFVLEEGRSEQLTDLRGGASEPTWSPDGTHIAFAARSDEGDGGRRDTDIFVMDADGSDVRNVAGTELNDGHPDWSPDGSRIVFHDVRAWPSAGIDSGIMRGRIWVVSLDDGEVLPIEQSVGYWSGADPAWSPDGRSIVYTRLPGSSINGRMPYAPLGVMRSDGSGQRPLVGSKWKRSGHCRFDASWSPDGSEIAFAEEGPRLGIIDLRSGEIEYVAMSAPVANLSWGTEGIVVSVGYGVAPLPGFGCWPF